MGLSGKWYDAVSFGDGFPERHAEISIYVWSFLAGFSNSEKRDLLLGRRTCLPFKGDGMISMTISIYPQDGFRLRSLQTIFLDL